MTLRHIKGLSSVRGHEFKTRLVSVAVFFLPLTLNCTGVSPGLDSTRIGVLPSKERELW